MSNPMGPTGLATTSTVAVTSATVPRMLLSQMPAGTQIVNNDLSNAIWISENPSATPGIGYQLGAQGSCTWQYDGQPCFAVLDTAATGPVNVTFGNSVSDIQNPLFVAEALAITGIPNVLVEDDLGQFILPVTTLNVSKYATIGVQAAGGINGIDVVYTFTDLHGNILSTGVVGSIGRPGNPAPSNPWSIPVGGPLLTITSALQPGGTIHLTATNRLTDRPLNQTVNTFNSQVGLFTSFTPGVDTRLGRISATGGLVYATFATIGFGGAHPQGIFQYTDPYGLEIQLCDTNEFYLTSQADTYRLERLMWWPASYGFLSFLSTNVGVTGGTAVVQLMGS